MATCVLRVSDRSIDVNSRICVFTQGGMEPLIKRRRTSDERFFPQRRRPRNFYEKFVCVFYQGTFMLLGFCSDNTVVLAWFAFVEPGGKVMQKAYFRNRAASASRAQLPGWAVLTTCLAAAIFPGERPASAGVLYSIVNTPTAYLFDEDANTGRVQSNVQIGAGQGVNFHGLPYSIDAMAYGNELALQYC